jgi:outer membrane protein assembly factor BamD (BamD/ComL family)
MVRAAVLLPVLLWAAAGCAQQRGGSDRWTSWIVPDRVEPNLAANDLDRLVGEYERSRYAIDRRELFFVQEGFRRLGEENSDNRVGEQAHLYVARIYADVGGYHDTIRTVDRFLRDYPRSEWRAEAERLRRTAEEEAGRYRGWRKEIATQEFGADT